MLSRVRCEACNRPSIVLLDGGCRCEVILFDTVSLFNLEIMDLLSYRGVTQVRNVPQTGALYRTGILLAVIILPFFIFNDWLTLCAKEQTAYVCCEILKTAISPCCLETYVPAFRRNILPLSSTFYQTARCGGNQEEQNRNYPAVGPQILHVLLALSGMCIFWVSR